MMIRTPGSHEDGSRTAASAEPAPSARPSRGDATREKLLASGHDLMLARGYSATSVDDICSASGVSKGSFYHFFDSKEGFGLAVLEAFHREGVERVRAGGYVRIEDPVERLRGFFDHLEAIAPEFWAEGCLLGTFAAELGETSPAIHARVAELFDELVARLTPVFLAVVLDEEEAAALAEETLVVIEGAVIMARAHDDPARIATGIRRYRISLEARIPELSRAS
ncbi:MAG: TetR/AcrR family transcriptional regulator [Candidatus Palauibacterales bacterium]|nr:TetR/AcrR family transcriptional regulator [Candidatus Palauibacterales bacterium]MDP2529129.1 TetR/AcrR family transcriptional regulator [Candidatus Palauibacterales bacterium]MDP2583924.1 TetR/AcrR family transcriptional regulator [Candidatus Palauibacterales bacterium]